MTASAPILARLARLHPKRIDLSLGRLRTLLDRLGNPEQRLPPVIHIAGTNGKGSVVAFIRAILEAAGRRVHVYTSPHLIRFHERIVLAGDIIDDDILAATLDACERANDGAPITFFEITTAAALLAFESTPADVLILETGLGGRLDATNVVDRPAATVITPISLDHQEFLGDTLAQIAAEKAGILKPGVAAVSSRQTPEALAVIRERAASVGAPLLCQDQDWHVQPRSGGFRFDADGFTVDLPLPALAGAHQVDNAGTAVAALMALTGITVSTDALGTGIGTAVWPGRLQPIRGLLTRSLPVGWELWIDGAHNPGAARVLAEHAATAWSERPLDIIVGVLRTKDLAAFLAPFAGQVRRLVGVPVPGEVNAFSGEEIAAAAQALGLDATPAPDAGAALVALASGACAPGRILVCGSLYLAGRVLAENVGQT